MGYKDPWAKASYTKRQRAIARKKKKSTVFTPQLLFNLEERFLWRLRGLPEKSSQKVGTLEVTQNKNEISAVFSPLTTARKNKKKISQYTLYTAILGFHYQVTPHSGENKNAKLKSDFVVLSLKKSVMKLENKKSQKIQFHSKHSHIISEKMKKTFQKKKKSVAIVVWVSPQDSFRPIQTTGGYINSF